jgi:23S rRNA (uridine2552-2'-O)-methyltransferase
MPIAVDFRAKEHEQGAPSLAPPAEQISGGIAYGLPQLLGNRVQMVTGLAVRPSMSDFGGNDPFELGFYGLAPVFQSFEQGSRIHEDSVSDPGLSTRVVVKRSGDYYSRLARQRDFPARSVFKLEEMQERFSLIEAGRKVLDLGCSPGSWSKYCLRLLGPEGQLVGVDLEMTDISQPPGWGYRFLQGDIFSDSIRIALEELGPFDLVLSDMAPRTTGNSLVDAQRSLELADRALEISLGTLNPEGHLVVKVFQGGEEGQLLQRMKTHFRRARGFKPKASRGESRETYFLGFFYAGKS